MRISFCRLYLDVELPTGDYTLAAYTRAQLGADTLGLFRKRLHVASCRPNTQTPATTRRVDDFEVRFYPEGGALIPRQPCRLAFRAVGDDGMPVEIVGEIVDSLGQQVSRLKSNPGGVGSCELIAGVTEPYYATCRLPSGQTRRFELPRSASGAVALHLLQSDSMIYLFRRSAAAQGCGRLLVQSRGCVIFDQPWPVQTGRMLLHKSRLPEGIVRFLLLDERDSISSQRLMFNSRASQAHVQITATPAEHIGRPRGRITLDIKVTDLNGNPLDGNLALAVTDCAVVPQRSEASAYAGLLLCSEVAERVENPDWYFDGEDRLIDLDNLMLTSTLKYPDISPALRGELPQSPAAFERYQQMEGQIAREGLFVKKNELHRYKLMALAPRFGDLMQVDVADDGTFRFDKLDYPDSTRLLLCALSQTRQGSKLDRWSKVRVTPPTFARVAPLPSPRMVPLADSTARASTEQGAAVAQAREYVKWAGSADLRNVMIDAVEVVGAKEKNLGGFDENTPPELWMASHTWTADRIQQSGMHSILSVLLRMPGVRVEGSRLLYRNRRLGVVVDDMLDPSTMIVNELGDDAEMDMLPMGLDQPIEYVARIDLIDGSQAFGRWGRGAESGVVVITLKSHEQISALMNNDHYTNITTPLGYQMPVSFSPRVYEGVQRESTRVPDYRTTLYWNPAVKISGGHAEVTFWLSDAITPFRISAEGLSGGVVIKADLVP